MEEKLRRTKITSKLCSLKDRLTDSDIDAVQDRLIERHIVKFDIKAEFDGMKISRKVDKLLETVFKANACKDLLDILNICGFEDVVSDIDNSDVPLPSEEMYSRPTTCDLSESKLRRDATSTSIGNADTNMLASKISSLEELMATMAEQVVDTHKNSIETKQYMMSTLDKLQEGGSADFATLTNYKTEVEKLNAIISELEEKHATEEEKFSSLRNAYKGLKQQLEEKRKRLADLTKKQSELEDIKQQNFTLQKDMTNLSVKHQQLQEEIGGQKKTLQDKKECHERELTMLTKEIIQLEKELEVATTEKHNVEECLKREKTNTEKLEKQIKVKHEELVRLDRKLKIYQFRIKKDDEETVNGQKVVITPRSIKGPKRNQRKERRVKHWDGTKWEY